MGTNRGTIANCTVRGSLTSANVGGVANINAKIISNCSNYATINATNEAGGIAQYLDSKGQIVNSQNYGTIINLTNESGVIVFHTGGIVSSASGSILNCKNYADVTGYRVGGIAGCMTGNTIIACYNEGVITGLHKNYAHPGGIVGLSLNATIQACYNKGVVKAAEGITLTYGAGGIVGYNSGNNTICGCYNSTGESSEDFGGLVGYIDWDSSLTAESCYYDGADDVCGSYLSEFTNYATKIDGTTTTWETATSKMNNALTSASVEWKYVQEQGNDVAPTLINEPASGN